MRWALVTGTSTGIGRAIALRLLRDGVNVFAGVRRQADADSLAAEAAAASASNAGAGRLLPVTLDVTNEDDVQAVIELVSRSVGPDGLWALVNNAGIVVAGPIEHISLAEWHRQFDANFFSVAELTRLSLPLLRQAVATLGTHVPRIMLVSSIGGRVAQPMLSPYNCSKFATTAFGDSLRMELRRQGIGVTVLEPGAIATAIWGKGESTVAAYTAEHPARPLYSPEIDGLIQISRKTAQAAIPADQAAEVAVKALFSERAPARVLVGRDAKIIAVLRRWLPLSWFDAVLLREFGVGSLPIGLQMSAQPAAK